MTERATVLAPALLLLVVTVGGCAAPAVETPSPSSAMPSAPSADGCPDVPDRGDVQTIGASRVAVVVPAGWHAMKSVAEAIPEVGPESKGNTTLTLSRGDPHLTLTMDVMDVELAEAVVSMEDPPTGTALVIVRGLGPVSVDRVADGERVGLAYRRTIGAESVAVRALGPLGVCDRTLVQLLGLVTLPR